MAQLSLVHSSSDEAQALQRLVGLRVRATRNARGLSRRVLSERSGVSPRYLAQLEAGEGNISIALLQRVAQALDHPVEAFLAADPDVASLFRAADPTIQAQVLALLRPDAEAVTRANRICLIGLRGAGKSTLGAEVGRALDLPFVELNRAIAEAGGMPVAEIIALYGQEGYRQLEADALDAIVARHDRVIVAVAGGIVAEPATFDRLLERFHTIWLKAAPEEHMARVRAQGDTRPMEGNPQAMAQLRLILSAREALYARADAELDTTGQSVDSSRDALIDLIARHEFLD